jgi:DNA-binding transcriptional MerR regulator
MQYKRSQISKLTDIHIETLRYYESLGLIPSPERDSNGYKLYNDETIKTLIMIKQAKSCGLTLEEIKEVLSLLTDINNVDYKVIAEFIDQKLSDLDKKIEEINHSKSILNKIKTNIDNNVECPLKKSF